MNITNKMEREIECLKYFSLNLSNYSRVTKSAKIKYFEWSMQGKHKFLKALAETPKKSGQKYNGFETLIWANTWRNRYVYEIYEPAILGGMGYRSFIGETTPECVVEYLAKTMFRGKDYELIKNIQKEKI